MPPRIPLVRLVKTTHVQQLRATNPFSPRSFLASPSRPASTIAQRRRHRDPYAIAAARAKKQSNISRQQVLQKERAAALGDPVRGITTSFVKSFDSARPLEGESRRFQPKPSSSGTLADQKAASQSNRNVQYLNHFLQQSEIDGQLKQSKSLFYPVPPPRLDGESEEAFHERIVDQIRQHESQHDDATEAIRRIVDLDNSGAKDRLRVNIQRCIHIFGRHETDRFLPPKAPAVPPGTPPKEVKAPKSMVIQRAGPDTGSSEVQIAILTARIRSLANNLETRGKKDKVGKRDLRLLVHRRQKLLKYLHRKERGGPRWQRCIETLGLTEGTWQGEITL